jgi:hypothetical protein
MKRDDLIKTAEGIMEVIPCDPAIPTDEDTEDEDILNGIKEAAELIEDTDVDSFDEEVIENLKKLKCWNPIVTKAKKTTTKKMAEEEVEEEEKPPVKKTSKAIPTPAKKEKVAPVKKEKVVKEKKDKTPAYTRVDAVCEALLEKPKTIKEWSKKADGFIISNGGKANEKENIAQMVKIRIFAKHFDIGIKIPVE